MIKVLLNIISMILAVLIITSCSSVKKIDEDTTQKSLVKLNPDLYRLEANCVLNSTMNNQSYSFKAKINIAGTDTVSMTLYGPFGITLGRLYSDMNKFIFLNVMENTLYRGSPTQDNIKKATNLSISIKDFLSLFQGKTPFDIEEYTPIADKNDGSIVLKRIDKSDFGDFAVINKSDMKLIQYQRKDKGDLLILNSAFDKYQSSGTSSLPAKINFSMPTVGGSLIIEVEDFKTNTDAPVPIPFNIPSSVKVIDLNN